MGKMQIWNKRYLQTIRLAGGKKERGTGLSKAEKPVPGGEYEERLAPPRAGFTPSGGRAARPRRYASCISFWRVFMRASTTLTT